MTRTLLLGLLFVTMAILCDGAYALLAGSARDLFRNNRRFLAAQRYFAGVTYCALGLLTAVTGSRSK